MNTPDRNRVKQYLLTFYPPGAAAPEACPKIILRKDAGATTRKPRQKFHKKTLFALESGPS